MNVTVRGFQLEWANNDAKTVEVEVDLSASLAAGVWLIDDENDNEFRMIVGKATPEDAARAHAAHRKAHGLRPPTVYRVFPLLSLEPIAEHQLGTGVDDEDTWSAFSNAWIEVRL